MHTPAPWSLDRLYNGPTVYVVGSDGVSVANLRKHPERDDAEMQANAKLIAAAPELLAALIRLRDLDVNCTQAEDVAAWAQAHAAIAKAQG
jgi:hypothetical protein